VAYMLDGDLGQVAARSPICEAARRAAKSHDAASATLISLLERPIAGHQTARIAQRVRELRRLFDRLSVDEACLLRTRLNDRGDALARFFDCELSTALRADLRARLERSCRRARSDPSTVGPRSPNIPPTPPVGPPRKPDWWKRIWPPPPPPEGIREQWPPRIKDPKIRIPELLDHARRVLEALLAAGITVGIVAALAAAIAEVKALLAAFGVFGVTGSLIYDVKTGRLGFIPLEGAHHTELHRRARAMQSPDWRKLENALQRLHRLDERGLDQLKASRTSDARPRLPSAPEQRPSEKPSGQDRRIATLLHGTTAIRARRIVSAQAFAPQRTYFTMGRANEDLARIFALRASSRNQKEGGPAIIAVRVNEEVLARLRQLRMFRSEPFDAADRPELRNRLQWVLERGGIAIFNEAIEEVEQLP
jgi:hypothetical protein